MLIPFIISSVLIAYLAKFLLDREPVIVRNVDHKQLNSQTSGNKLYQELLGLNRFHLANGKNIELTRYKFFTEMLDELLTAYRSSGANIFGHVLEIRKNLIHDLKTEKKLASLCKGSWVEMAMIGLLGVCFVLFAKFFAGIEISLLSCLGAFAWQAAGAAFFIYSERSIKKRIFSPFYQYLRRANLLDVYLKTNRPVNLIAKELELEALPSDTSMNHLKERMEEILRLVKERGGCDPEQTKELGMECWFCHDQKLEEFMQAVKRLKLAIIALFFLTGYLFLFYALVAGIGDSY